ncbi:semaphorin-4D-like [Rhinatrema bivittatum]|uniref:semaphorin-4D-like n=1 Tax=Rhinatrema bivittatum TaxID=194408 RepID=UPI001125FC06|nr:semaphorin-4D-like [Rhinatrema bivittatum]
MSSVMVLRGQASSWAMRDELCDGPAKVSWKANEDQRNECIKKEKLKSECMNYVRVLQPLNDNVLYVCGTNAFRPICDHLLRHNLFIFFCVCVEDGELYSGTSLNFLGSEKAIFRKSQGKQISTEYNFLWLIDPEFVSVDLIRGSPKGDDDDKVYFFFTEVAVEQEYFGKVLIPRVARVCKGDQGGLKILWKRWTSFLKATLLCRSPDLNYVFNVVNDVFILKSPSLKEPLIYGVFTAQFNNIGMSAVCVYSMTSIEKNFAEGPYMNKPMDMDSKWARHQGDIPYPRPGMCINSFDRANNYNSSLSLPDKTLLFAKDHHMMYDAVTTIGINPILIKQNVNYLQIVVDQVEALDKNIYYVMFIGTERGTVQKAISGNNKGPATIIEEIKLYPYLEHIDTMHLFSKKNERYIYTGSVSGVVQIPVAFCDKHGTCVDCVLAKDPYCAWNPRELSCVNILQKGNTDRNLIQKFDGDASVCIGKDKIKEIVVNHMLNPGNTAKLECYSKSNYTNAVWSFGRSKLNWKNPKYQRLNNALLIFDITKEDTGDYQCVLNKSGFDYQVVKHVLKLNPAKESNL